MSRRIKPTSAASLTAIQQPLLMFPSAWRPTTAAKPAASSGVGERSVYSARPSPGRCRRTWRLCPLDEVGPVIDVLQGQAIRGCGGRDYLADLDDVGKGREHLAGGPRGAVGDGAVRRVLAVVGVQEDRGRPYEMVG